jgi:CTP:molybdopterin cytidylyltransferase MocA/ADP-ribose pyrophosphatase YjhB (NUDIX family)
MVGAIVLAAGSASRMGRPKLLLPLQGQSLIRRVVGVALASAARPVVVVTGAWQELVEAELAGLPVRFAHNPEYAEGMSTSLRAGLRALGPDGEAAIVLLGDQPLVDRSIVDRLIDLFCRSHAPIVRPRYAGRPGNPVLWARELFPRLLEQGGDQGGRTVLREMKDQIVWLDVSDELAGQDVDTPEAYDALREAVERQPHTHGPSAERPRFCPRCAGRLVPRSVEGRQRPVCETCGEVFWIDPKVAVAVLIPWEAGLLLGRRAIDPGRDRWSFPAGYVDRGEVLEAAACREVAEETGLDVRIAGLVGAYSTAGRPLILIAYAGEVIGGKLVPGPEVTEVDSFPPSSLPEMAFEHDERIVADWLALRARRGSP